MQQLEALGTEQTKQTFIRHGAQEPLFGVKIGELTTAAVGGSSQLVSAYGNDSCRCCRRKRICFGACSRMDPVRSREAGGLRLGDICQLYLDHRRQPARYH